MKKKNCQRKRLFIGAIISLTNGAGKTKFKRSKVGAISVVTGFISDIK